jgi:cell volume regulation protein A
VPEIDPWIAAAGLLVIGAIGASKISARLGVPALLLFLALGMAAGSEGPGGIEFNDFATAQSVGIVALAFILFAGGLDTEWSEVRPVVAPGLCLATVGVAASAVIAGAAAAWLLGLPLATGLLLGSIMSSTDAAAVFSVLRSQKVGLRGRIRPLLELESGSNDPMAIFLTLAFLTVVDEPSASVPGLLLLFVQQMVVGGVFGHVLARVAVWALNRVRLEHDGLYPVMMIGIVALIYGTTTLLGGSGFLAVYVAGLTMSGARFIHRKSLIRFQDAIAWVGQISMFLLLGLLVFPSALVEVAPHALLISAVLIFVARPVAVLLSLFASRFALREMAFVGWVGLRGAVPIILATFPLVEGIDRADEIFNVVFFVVLTSVLLQGTSVSSAARRLGVAQPWQPRRNAALDYVQTGSDLDLHELEVAPHAPAAGRRLLELGMPPETVVVLVSRDGEYVTPQGATTFTPGDAVLVLAREERLDELRRIFQPPTDAHDASAPQ